VTEVLILGGTGWLSGRIARRWRDAGAAVTCFARGIRPAPDGTRLVAGDRTTPGALSAVADREWDAVVDVTSEAAWAASALAALGERARHWTDISSVSVYADDHLAGADETAATVPSGSPGDDLDYPRAKATIESAVRAQLGDRAAIIRPGLIVGPGDTSDRFGYWVSRFALAADQPVLVPEARGLGASVIDVDDLAAFVVGVGRTAWAGTVNAIGDPVALDELLAQARGVAGHTGPLVAAPDAWLRAHEVEYWAGPRSLPLWLPRDLVGFWGRSNLRYRERGGTFRPLEDTLRRTLDDERVRGLDRRRRAGLSRDDELALLRERD
jgi:nucleoside-diphosphate-sugar epimerase